MASYSNFVIVDHGGGIFSFYGHLLAGIVVEPGDPVRQGQLLGYSGNTGYTNCGPNRDRGYHLHFQLQATGEDFNDSIPIPCFDGVEGGVPQRGMVLAPAETQPEIGFYLEMATVTPDSITNQGIGPESPLDKTNPESIVEWFAWALATGDMSIMENLFSQETVNYGHGLNADGGFANYPREEFLGWMAERMPSQPVCAGYVAGEVRSMIWTSGWNPWWPTPWEPGASRGSSGLTFTLYLSPAGEVGWGAHFTPSYLILEVPSVDYNPCPFFSENRSAGPGELVGTWQGMVSGGGEGSSYNEVRRVRITNNCPSDIETPICLEFFWTSDDSQYLAYKGEEEEGYCFWKPLDLPGYPEAYEYKFCFRLSAAGTLDYIGHGNLWFEEGVLEEAEP
jgi:hypothetical protein